MKVAAVASPAVALPAGTRFGRYELLRRLAVGGMAEIFLARASGIEDFRKLVVIKRILPQLSGDDDFVKMFLDEARLAGTLVHPNIAQVFDIGREGDQYFFSMEYVHGRNLHQVMRAAEEQSYQIPIELAVAIVLGVCAGLHHAHGQRDEAGAPMDIVHRDISPTNVIVSLAGTVKVVDFGIAKAASHRAVTREGLLKGKVAYMSPEQCTGGALDRRSDIFAIGILLYELTTGVKLFTGDTDYAILHQIVDVDVPRPSARRPGYPPELEEIVLRALRRDRDGRYRTAEEMQIELENFLREAKLVASPIEIGRMMRDLFRSDSTFVAGEDTLSLAFPRRRSPWMTLAGGAILVLSACLGLATEHARQARVRAPDYQSFDEQVAAEQRWGRMALGGGLLGTALVLIEFGRGGGLAAGGGGPRKDEQARSGCARARPRAERRATGVVRSALTSALGLSVAVAPVGETRAVAGAAGAFSVEVVTDQAVPGRVVVLRFTDATNPTRSLEARVAADQGANLFSFKVGDEELLAPPEIPAKLAHSPAGTPILFPTPNRVRDAAFTFRGRRFTFTANSGRNFIHGLVKDRPWQAVKVRASHDGAAADLFIDWDAVQPDFAQFPLKHRLTVTFTLRKDGLRIAFAAENQDKTPLPFGFALHPFFRVPGQRADVRLQVPVPVRMEAVALLPTGKLEPVAGTRFDLRKPTSLEGLDLDDVYFGLSPRLVPAFEWVDRGVRVTMAGSAAFTHMVVYTPPGQKFFCLENQTCSTDAHNLDDQGHKKEAHLSIAAPGKTVRGHVDWIVTRTAR